MITLIGEKLANEGESFIFYEPAEECSKCRFKASCIDSLEEGHKYVITEVRDVEQKCPIHEGEKVKVVVVEKGETTILTDSKGVLKGLALNLIVKAVQIRIVTIGICVSLRKLQKERNVYILKTLGSLRIVLAETL